MMIIRVGTLNKAKLAAVTECFRAYYPALEVVVHPCDIASGVRPQPLSLEEIITGASNRAKGAYFNANLSLGIEGGLMPCSEAASGCFEVSAAAAYDGSQLYTGLSAAFEHPQAIIDLVLKRGLTVSAAYRAAGYTDDEDVGASQGAIGLLSAGRILRKDYVKEAVLMAFLHVPALNSKLSA